MDLKQWKDLIEYLEKRPFQKIHLKDKEWEISIEKKSKVSSQQLPQEFYEELPPKPSEKPIPPQEEVKGDVVSSPMVGTLYRSPSPDQPAYVKVGDQVDQDTIVCIVEAMKVMNEVKAGMKGKVVEIFVKDGQPVEFGSPLLRIV